MAPISKSHEEIKECEDENLLKYDLTDDYTAPASLCVRGIPVESGSFAPLMLLVPHLAMQSYNYSVSMLNISTIIA